MKTTWKTTIEDLDITSLYLRVESADIECDVCITPGSPDTRECPGSDPTCEIYEIRVLSADGIGAYSGSKRSTVDDANADFIKQDVRRRLLDSGWHEQPEVLDRCLQEISEELQDADEYAREMAAESRRERYRQ